MKNHNKDIFSLHAYTLITLLTISKIRPPGDGVCLHVPPGTTFTTLEFEENAHIVVPVERVEPKGL